VFDDVTITTVVTMSRGDDVTNYWVITFCAVIL